MSGEPFDRLTELCAEMQPVLDRAENSDIKAIIMLHDDTNGGIQTYRIENMAETVSMLLLHLQAIFAAHGQSITVMTNSGILDMNELGN